MTDVWPGQRVGGRAQQSQAAWPGAPISQAQVQPQQTTQPAAQPRRAPVQPLSGNPREQILGFAPGARVSSGYRTPDHNREVGGARNSYHTRGTGQAMDLVPAPGESMAQLRARLASSGLPLAENINEGDHVHVAWEGAGLGDPMAAPAAPAAAEVPQEPIAVEIDQGVYEPGFDTIEKYVSGNSGYRTAREQEEARRRLLETSGIGMNATDFTTPLNDELAGAAGYITQGLGNIGRQLTGQGIEVGAADRARAATDTYRDQQNDFAKENPLQAAFGSVAGGLAMAPARAAGALGPAQNFLRTSSAFVRPTAAQAYTGAGVAGAAFGAADAEGGLPGRALGAGLGAAGGVATLGVLDAAGAGIGRMLNRGPRLSQQENRVGQVINRELRANRVTPQELEASLNALPAGGLPLNASDGVLAPMAEALVATTGPGGRNLSRAIDTQRAGSGDRIMSRVANEVGGEGNYFQQLDNLTQQRRVAARDVMDQIGNEPVRLDDASVRALRSNLVQGQIRRAAENALVATDQATYEMGANLNRLADTLRDNPAAAQLDVRSAQDISRALLDMSDGAFRRGDGDIGQALKGVGRSIRDNARQTNQGYDQWLRRYGDESSQIEALETGRRIFRNADDPSADGMSAEVLRREFGEMSDTAKDQFRKGVGEALVARARTSRGGIGAMRDLVKSDEFADRVRIAFPDEQAFTRFLNAAEAEVGMANAGNSITGNSNTARRQQTIQRLGGQPEQQAVDQLSQTTLTGIPLALGRAGLRAAGRAAGRSRSVLENDDLNELLGRALKEPEVLRALLQRSPQSRGLFAGRAPVAASTIPQQAF